MVGFRKRFLQALGTLIVVVLVVAEAMGLVKPSSISLDNTKIKANTSNLMGEESRIMRTSSGGFEQTYNTQAGVTSIRAPAHSIP